LLFCLQKREAAFLFLQHCKEKQKEQRGRSDKGRDEQRKKTKKRGVDDKKKNALFSFFFFN